MKPTTANLAPTSRPIIGGTEDQRTVFAYSLVPNEHSLFPAIADQRRIVNDFCQEHNFAQPSEWYTDLSDHRWTPWLERPAAKRIKYWASPGDRIVFADWYVVVTSLPRLAEILDWSEESGVSLSGPVSIPGIDDDFALWSTDPEVGNDKVAPGEFQRTLLSLREPFRQHRFWTKGTPSGAAG